MIGELEAVADLLICPHQAVGDLNKRINLPELPKA